jgi:hypothetical protein
MAHETRFDRQAGMVVDEWSLSALSPTAKAWAHAAPGNTEELKNWRNEKGAAKLYDMVVRSILGNLPLLTPEHFQGIPWVIAVRLWARIQSKYAYSFLRRTFPNPLVVSWHPLPSGAPLSKPIILNLPTTGINSKYQAC